jgi:DNA-binding SARP family transcriptional activator
VLDPELGGAAPLIVRDGDAYRLDLRPDDEVDVVEFDRAIAGGRLAETQGDADAARASLQRALDLYHGELLSEDGPAEWLVRERERRRFEASTAAQELARLLLARGEPAAAAAACERGFYANPFHDALWRLCIEAYEAAGNPAAAARTGRRYDEVLAALGLKA